MADANMAQALPSPVANCNESTATCPELEDNSSVEACASLGVNLDPGTLTNTCDETGNADASSVEPPVQHQLAVPVWATHEAVRLTCQGMQLEVLVDRRDQKRRVVSLARAGEPYHRLRLDARRGLTLKLLAARATFLGASFHQTIDGLCIELIVRSMINFVAPETLAVYF